MTVTNPARTLSRTTGALSERGNQAGTRYPSAGGCSPLLEVMSKQTWYPRECTSAVFVILKTLLNLGKGMHRMVQSNMNIGGRHDI